MKPDELAWLRDQRGELDLLIAESCRPDGRAVAWSNYEWTQAFQDLLTLSRGLDCCYDRPSIGIQYALWYHGRRTEAAIRALDLTLDRSAGPIEVVDLGCGTGAGAWAIALIEAARVATGAPPRDIHITGVDLSSPMLDHAERMWAALTRWLSRAGIAHDLEVDWLLETWTASRGEPFRATIVFGSYFLDWSDVGRARDLARGLRGVVDASYANAVVLTGTEAKTEVLAGVTGAFTQGSRWADAGPTTSDGVASSIWTGSMPNCGEVRRQIAIAAGMTSSLTERPPTWRREETYVTSLIATGVATQPVMMAKSPTAMLVLDDEQVAAATPEHRLAAILGAAGSGKSRVLIERVVQALERSNRNRRPMHVLVTTFNKPLTTQLHEWLLARLDSAAIGRASSRGGEGDMRISFAGRDLSIRLLNWDKVPSRLFGLLPGSGQFTSAHARRARSTLDEVAAFRGLEDPERMRFVDAELARVIYGLRCTSRGDYLGVDRAGRQRRLQKGDRGPIYDFAMGQDAPRTFTHARIDAWSEVARGSEPNDGKYDLVAIDEYQDLTYADFDIALGLAKDARSVLVAGDPAQALHLGKSSGRPGSLGRRHWKEHPLRGSYRLPIRVCEAIEPIARSIAEQRQKQPKVTTSDPLVTADPIQLPQSVKGAVLGIRPIVIAGTASQVATDLADVLETYRRTIDAADGPRQITIAEGDAYIADVLGTTDVGDLTVQQESMRRIKGLERPCIIWSTRAAMPGDESTAEWIYTIVSRTTSVLILVLSERTPGPVRRVVSQLRRDRLLFWSENAEATFDRWRSSTSAESIARY